MNTATRLLICAAPTAVSAALAPALALRLQPAALRVKAASPFLYRCNTAVREASSRTSSPQANAALAARATAEATALFGNIRVPAALLAGLSVPLGFAVPLPNSEDRPAIRVLKAINIAVGFLCIQSELLSIVTSTNAINRLTAGGSGFVSAAAATTSLELFKSDPALLQHWLGTYIHFMLGVFGVVVMCGIRGWLAVGPTFGAPLLIGMCAILARMTAMVNRGIIAQEFAAGNCILLLVKFLATFTTNTLSFYRWLDLASLSLLIWTVILIFQRGRAFIIEMCDEDGDGDVSGGEFVAALGKLKGDFLSLATK